MNYFWDLVEEIPGLRGIRTEKGSGSTMAGWYACKGMYDPEAFHGLPSHKFCEAVRAEFNGYEKCCPGANFCLHTHNLFKKFDFRNAGKASTIEYMDAAEYYGNEGCERSLEDRCFTVPWFKKYDKEFIEKVASCFKKVADNHLSLLDGEIEQEKSVGRWYGTSDD